MMMLTNPLHCTARLDLPYSKTCFTLELDKIADYESTCIVSHSLVLSLEVCVTNTWLVLRQNKELDPWVARSNNPFSVFLWSLWRGRMGVSLRFLIGQQYVVVIKLIGFTLMRTRAYLCMVQTLTNPHLYIAVGQVNQSILQLLNNCKFI
jgi:hypothetical protein